MKILKLFPLTYPWIIKYHMKDIKKVLDLGCGDGSFMAILNKNKEYKVTGVELFEPYLNKAKRLGVYKRLIKKDIRKRTFKKGSFDVLLCSQVIEHLEKEEGLKLIPDFQQIAAKVIIGTPNGHFSQEGYDKNHLQRHKSTWSVEDFEKMGFKVYGQGLKIIYGEDGLLTKTICKNIFIKTFLYAISYATSIIVYFMPRLAAHIIAIK